MILFDFILIKFNKFFFFENLFYNEQCSFCDSGKILSRKIELKTKPSARAPNWPSLCAQAARPCCLPAVPRAHRAPSSAPARPAARPLALPRAPAARPLAQRAQRPSAQRLCARSSCAPSALAPSARPRTPAPCPRARPPAACAPARLAQRPARPAQPSAHPAATPAPTPAHACASCAPSAPQRRLPTQMGSSLSRFCTKKNFFYLFFFFISFIHWKIPKNIYLFSFIFQYTNKFIKIYFIYIYIYIFFFSFPQQTK